jgi:hypothetical protein
VNGDDANQTDQKPGRPDHGSPDRDEEKKLIHDLAARF